MTTHMKSFVALEMPLVLEQLAEHCQFSARRELAINIRPTKSIDVAECRQIETTEARLLLKEHQYASVGNACDVRGEVNRAKLSAILQPIELVRIRSTLDSSRVLKKTILGTNNKFEILCQRAKMLVDLPELEHAIDCSIDNQAEVLSTASNLLGKLREQSKSTNNELLQKLEHITQNPNNSKFLQESIITRRSDRYVILLKSNFKGRIPGILHGQSTSGSTLFIEPIVTVELNNQLQELQIAEQREIIRVLQSLSEKVSKYSKEIENNVEILAMLDLAFARANYAEAITATQPILLSWANNDNEYSDDTKHVCSIKLLGARHPLLSPKDVVAIDFVVDNYTNVIVITGPNTGGKTVCLKTIGLLSLMAASGLHLPVDSGSELPIFNGIFADIGDEQSIKQSLSTFSSHINNIKNMLKNIDSRSLVLLDEIGAGTDPDEGSALAQALLEYVLQNGSMAVVTTHYQRLKIFSHNTDRVKNASVDFNPKTLQPSYNLTIGLPGRSNALTIAHNLKMPKQITDRAKQLLSPSDQKADSLLADIYQHRETAIKAQRKQKQTTEQLEAQKSELQIRLDNIDDERRSILLAGRKQVENELQSIRSEINDMRHHLKQSKLDNQVLMNAEKKIRSVEAKPRLSPEDIKSTKGIAKKRGVRLGDHVYVARLRTNGVVIALQNGEAEVQIGRLRLRSLIDELRPAKNSGSNDNAQNNITNMPIKSPSMELHLRGQRIEDGLENLDNYLTEAILAELPWVRIIHGKGTGQMRQAVREVLKDHPEVKSYRTGEQGEGGDGVTIVILE